MSLNCSFPLFIIVTVQNDYAVISYYWWMWHWIFFYFLTSVYQSLQWWITSNHSVLT